MGLIRKLESSINHQALVVEKGVGQTASAVAGGFTKLARRVNSGDWPGWEAKGADKSSAV